MNVEMFFGGRPLQVTLPEGSLLETLEIPYFPPIDNPEDEVMRSLRRPVGTPPLRELAQGRKRVVVIVPDRTRPAPLAMILPLIMGELEEAGVRRSDITVIIGIGTHRPMGEEEILSHLGGRIVGAYTVMNHEWWKEEEIVHLGMTGNGTPIQVNRRVHEADLTIAVGGVKPHGVVGWSGGAKMIQPAVSGFEATGMTHWLSSQFQCTGERIVGVVDNPVRREMEEFAGIVGLDFIVNYVLNRDYALLGVRCGHYVEAHRECVDLARPMFTYRCRTGEPADVLLVGTSKAQTNMWALGTGPSWMGDVLKTGGTVILLAPCPDGVAEEHPDVARYGYLPYESVRTLVEEGKITDLGAADHIARAGTYIHRSALQCILVSEGVSREEAERLHLEHAATAEEAVARALQRHGPAARFRAAPGATFAGLLVEREGSP